MLYINEHPYKTKQEAYHNDVSILSLKNLRLNKGATPLEATEFFLGWFEDIKQPTEKKVRDAMLLVIRDVENEFRYTLKAGGGAASDNMFSSSVQCLVMDKDGNDKMVTFFTKYSSKFENVLITLDELHTAIINNMSPEETTKAEIEEVQQLPKAFLNTLYRTPNFKIPSFVVSKIKKHESTFMNSINRFIERVEKDILTHSSTLEYSKVYEVRPNESESELLIQLHTYSERYNVKLNHLNDLKQQYLLNKDL